MKKHIKLYILILFEALFILFMIRGSFTPAMEMTFSASDFTDNIRGREDHISTEDDTVSFTYDPTSFVYDSDGNSMGEEMLSYKFALGSGAYVMEASYHSDDASSLIGLTSESRVTDAITTPMELTDGRESVSQMVYVPFGRSLHDIQMGITYYGPGPLEVYGITLKEDTSYRWVPIAGYILLFAFLDLFVLTVFMPSGRRIRAYLREHYEVVVLSFIFLASSLPLFNDRLYLTHDLRFHLARIMGTAAEAGYGQFPIRMLTDMLQGHSYPTPTFYCGFFLYPFAVLHHLGLPLRMTLQCYLLAVNAVSTVIAYFCLMKATKDRILSLTCTALYILSIYRLIDLYIRCALGEITAMAFIPLVVYGMYLLYHSKEPKRSDWKYLAAGMSGIALCHLLTLEMLSIFLFLFCIFEYKKTFTLRIFGSILTAAIVTVAISCYFLIPMSMSMGSIDLSMFDHQYYIQAQGAYPVQVFNPFTTGSGFSHAGTYEEMPLSIGGGMLASLALLVFASLRSGAQKNTRRIIWALTIISLAFSMYFFPWDSIAGIFDGRIDALSRLARMVQYPWRFLEITTVVLCASAVMELVLLEDGRIRRMFMVAMILGTLITAGVYYCDYIDQNESALGTALDYMDDSIGGEEYLPSGAGDFKSDADHAITDPKESASFVTMEAGNGERYITVDGVRDDTRITIPVFAYPGYHVYDTGAGQELQLLSTEDSLIAFDVPSGYSGTIRVYYEEKASWRVLEVISALSIICFVFYFLYSSGRSKGS